MLSILGMSPAAERLWAEAMVVVAEVRDVWSRVMLDVRWDCRVCRVSSSDCRVVRVLRRAWCWDERAGRAEAFWAMPLWRLLVRVLERWVRRASFSGLRGMGGAGMLVGWMGRGRSKGESRREGAGGWCFGCDWVMGRFCCWLGG